MTLDGADLEGFAEGLHRAGDAVDLGGVAEVGEAVDGLRGRAETAGQLGGTVSPWVIASGMSRKVTT